MKSRLRTLLPWILALCATGFWNPGFAQSASVSNTIESRKDSGGLSCPEGFFPIPSGLACAAGDITWPATADVPPGDDCPAGFERHPGVRPCVAANLTLAVERGVMLLGSRSGDDCPEGFSRAVGSTICTADNLVLDVVDNEVRLVAYHPRCREGFHRPEGRRFCVAENLSPGALPPPPGCPPGFVKPPGVNFCVHTEIVYKGEKRLDNLPQAIGGCPEDWYRPDNVNFCIPQNKTAPCGSACGTGDPRVINIHNTFDFKPTPCPAGTVEIWWDMPVYDDETGLWIVDYIPTRFCIPEDLEPAG